MPITAKQIRQQVPMYRWTKEKAQIKLRQARDAIDALLTARTDAERARTFNRFEKDFVGYGCLSDLAVWSALAQETAKDDVAQVTCVPSGSMGQPGTPGSKGQVGSGEG